MPLRSRFSASAGADVGPSARPPLKIEAYPPPALRRAGTVMTPCAGRPQGSSASRRDSTAANARSEAAYAPYLLSMARFDQPPSTI
jgi:hypothetical protein